MTLSYISAFASARIAAASSLLLALACSSARYSAEPGAPTLILPARLAEGTEAAASAPPAPSASTTAPAASTAPAAVAALAPSKLPDPLPLRSADQVEYQLELSQGKLRVLSVKPVTLREPLVTPRRVGRWAIELSIGPELIERLRFDFPATAADEPTTGPRKLAAPLDLGSRAIARITLLVPHSPRVRRALLIDRASNGVTELDWPMPVVPVAAKAPAPAVPAATKAPAPPAASAAPQP